MLHRKLIDRYYALRRRDRYITWAVFVAVIILAIGIFRFTGNSILDEIIKEPQVRKVALEQVAILSTETTPLSIIGTVRSEKEAVLRTESTGIVTGVYKNVGDFVGAGTIIAEIKNDGARASVAQAKANLDKIQKGGRDEELSIVAINFKKAQEDLDSVKLQSINKLLSSYAVSSDVITRSADQIVSNPSSSNPQLNISTSESQMETDIENTRVAVEVVLSDFNIKKDTLSIEDDLVSELESASEKLGVIKTYLDIILSALNNAVTTQSTSSSQIELYKSDISISRTSILDSLSTLATQKQVLNATVSALNIAEENYNKGVVGGREEDVASAEAALRVAQANLEKTLIRTPISGRISSLSLSAGNFVSQFEHAAIVSNSNAIEIISFITEGERNNIAVGNDVIINGTLNGVVTSIAPGLDPQTKKIEVRIGVTDNSGLLTQGSSVEVKVARSRPASADEIEQIFIPISALKISTEDAYVFTISPEDTLIAHTVELGRILGDKVEITEGIVPEMFIVTDARGLKKDQKVITE